MRKKPDVKPSESDTPEMKEACARLDELKIAYRRRSRYQLKVDAYSFYPDTGTITEDDCPDEKQNGLETFIALVNRPPGIRIRFR